MMAARRRRTPGLVNGAESTRIDVLLNQEPLGASKTDSNGTRRGYSARVPYLVDYVRHFVEHELSFQAQVI